MILNTLIWQNGPWKLMEQKIADKEAQADAFSQVSGVQESENDPFAQMDKENSINAELEKLKQQMNGNNNN